MNENEKEIIDGEYQCHEIGKLAEALAKAQGAITGAKKGADNPFFKSKYADLATVWDACRKPLSDNGLSIIQLPRFEEGKVVLMTQINHSSGQWIRGFYPVVPTKQDPQGYGSAITYARRYCLAACVGVAQEDDDGNAASAPNKSKPALAKKVRDDVLSQTLACLSNGDASGLVEIWAEFSNEEKIELWPMFSPSQRSSIKELMKLGN